MGLVQLLYISDARGRVVPESLEAIRDVSVRNNAPLEITGILFYSQGHFVQLLEGDQEDVGALFETMVRDGRHQHIKLLYQRRATERAFEGWDMAVLDLEAYGQAERGDLEDLVHLAGYHVNHPVDRAPDLQILKRFRSLLPAA